jgi:hypothetical protein
MLLLLFMGSLDCAMAQAAKRSHKPAQVVAEKSSGQVVCTVRGCRPVRSGCRLEIVGAFTEEVCR